MSGTWSGPILFRPRYLGLIWLISKKVDPNEALFNAHANIFLTDAKTSNILIATYDEDMKILKTDNPS